MILTCYRHDRPRVRRTAHRSDIVGNTLNHVSFVGGFIRYILYTRFMSVPHYLCADSVLWCVSSEIAGDQRVLELAQAVLAFSKLPQLHGTML